MSTHNIQIHDKISKNPYIFVFLNYLKNFVGTEKRVRKSLQLLLSVISRPSLRMLSFTLGSLSQVFYLGRSISDKARRGKQFGSIYSPTKYTVESQ